MSAHKELMKKMHLQIQEWENLSDKKAIFLSCYALMTANMISAIELKQFRDNAWVDRLMQRFAAYYFDALSCYECRTDTPEIWEKVHERTRTGKLHVMQYLMLGVNAHINYDLVLTLVDLLSPEWELATADLKTIRYEDHKKVNQIIGSTIDQVQEDIIHTYSPAMEWLDRIMGRLDEKLILRVIESWRDDVWENAVSLLNCKDESHKLRLMKNVVRNTDRKADWIMLSFII